MKSNRFTQIAAWGITVGIWILLVVALFVSCSAHSQDPPQETGRVVVSDGDTELRVIVDERQDVVCYFFDWLVHPCIVRRPRLGPLQETGLAQKYDVSSETVRVKLGGKK